MIFMFQRKGGEERNGEGVVLQRTAVENRDSALRQDVLGPWKTPVGY
jgi:hypothetical protein